ncbi:hypothetical protein [Calothrix sp. 336/3]|uniref:hypothetical protein n=1 Tax=Calothrix sp. 336/3 TaxID=1337936 RepID=UPI0004E2C255|nr:hypothetical protein [Calothrix sp. 336/3]AKG21806.1 hypothetical protein IJ00_11540 [Calothrix sp. 336/3]
MKNVILIQTFIASMSLLTIFSQSANAQLIPQPWVSVGAKDGDTTYAVGAKALGIGAELGVGEDGATGVDVLKFLNLPVISPYVGLGYYSEDKGVAVSGGMHVNASDHLFLGVGYNSVRGINGQLGIKF